MDDRVEILLRRQKMLADFGDFSLQCEDLDEVLLRACHLVAEAMGTSRAKVLEIGPDGKTALVRAGVGWDDGVVGHVRLDMSEPTSESFAVQSGAPVITQDISEEQRFIVPEFMRKAGVVALANVPIFLPKGRAYGLLQVDDTRPRSVTRDDTEFLRTYAAVLGPVIDRLFKLRELRSTEQRFRITVEAATDYAIFITDERNRITDWLPGAEKVYGWSAAEVLGKSSSLVFMPEDRASGEDEKEIALARERGFAPNVRWHLRKDGSRVFIEGSVRTLRDPNGTLSGFIKIGQDVTERRAALDQQQVLLAEVQHRTRNLMAVVQRMADQTLANSKSLEDFGVRFRDRIAALARVQGLLSRLGGQDKVTFDQLVQSELEAHGGLGKTSATLQVEGPHGVALRSRMVQILAMAIHELCTNALKYGALRQPQARLSVRWRLEQEGGETWLFVDWRESGVLLAPGAVEEARSGAGRNLIERALPYQLGARTTFVLEPDGVHCTLAVPVSNKTAPQAQDS